MKSVPALLKRELEVLEQRQKARHAAVAELQELIARKQLEVDNVRARLNASLDARGESCSGL